MVVITEKVINGTEEEKIKTTERLKGGGRVIAEEENELKNTGNWFDTNYISVEKCRGKIAIPTIPVGANPLLPGIALQTSMSIDSCLDRIKSRRRQMIY